MDLGLKGRVCVVTGASRGIGAETAKLLCAEGASVLLVARNQERLEAAAREAAAAAAGANGRAAILSLDITDDDAGERMLAAASERFGALDVLVNNAGAAQWRDLGDVPEEDWRGQYELSVMAPLRAMRAAIPPMAERGWGRVVNVCSTAASVPRHRCPSTRWRRRPSSHSRASSPTATPATACSSTRSVPARSNRRCGWSPAACSTSPASSRAV